MIASHECPVNVPVCQKCGRRWAYLRRWSDGSVTYYSAHVKALYEAQYGPGRFEEVPREDPAADSA